MITMNPIKLAIILLGCLVLSSHAQTSPEPPSKADALAIISTHEQIKAAAHSHRAYYAKAPVEEGAEIGETEYAMDHSAYLYLMDPDGVYVHVFSPTDSADEIAAGIRGFLNK